LPAIPRFRDPNSWIVSHDPYDRTTKPVGEFFLWEGTETMNGWHGFTGLAGCALAVMLPACVMAAGFEDSVAVAERTESFLAAESVLVDDGLIGELPVDETENIAVDGVEEARIVMPPFACAECQHCSGVGCDSCPSFASCTDGGCGVGGSSLGWLNRRLGTADPRWIIQVDALMLWQGNIASRPLYTGALDVNQAQTPMSVGTRYGVIFNVDECRAIEGNYFQVGLFNGAASPLVAGPYTPNNLYGLDGALAALGAQIDSGTVFTGGMIKSAELNGRQATGGPLTWLAGFRWVEWNSDMLLTQQVSDGNPPQSASAGTITGNDLYGGQIGADLALWKTPRGPVTVNGIGKAGVFYNNAFQRSFGEVPGVGSSATAASTGSTAFFGEVGANANVRLARWLSWRAGYSLFWLNGVAVPASQIALTNLSTAPPTAAIDAGGSVFLHGVTTGLEARW
jgi:hypothetical protein